MVPLLLLLPISLTIASERDRLVISEDEYTECEVGESIDLLQNKIVCRCIKNNNHRHNCIEVIDNIDLYLPPVIDAYCAHGAVCIMEISENVYKIDDKVNVLYESMEFSCTKLRKLKCGSEWMCWPY